MSAENARRRLGWSLALTGWGVWLVGALLYLGNVSGLFPTFPYAGTLVTFAGAAATLIAGDPQFMWASLATGLALRAALPYRPMDRRPQGSRRPAGPLGEDCED